MKLTRIVPLVLILCGCEPPAPRIEPPPVKSRFRHPVLHTDVVCTFEYVRIPRSAHERLDRLWRYTETGGIYGGDPRLLAMNGLKVGRTDMRFQAQFKQALVAVKRPPRNVIHVRLIEGQKQDFEIGGVLKDQTLFVWTKSDSVVGRHFSQTRYRLLLTLEKVQENLAEFKLSWQGRTGPGLIRGFEIPGLDVHAEVETGQSVVIAPADFSGRGVGRALLSGVDESAVEMTLIVVTPTTIRKKT